MRDIARWILSSALACSLTAQARAPLTGVVVDPAGNPVAGARIEALRAEGMETVFLDLRQARNFRVVDRTRTGKDGTFALQMLDGLPCELRVDHPNWALWIEPAHLPTEGLRIELQRPTTFSGQVCVDALGVPAQIRAWFGSGCEILRARTDDHGRFRFTRLPPGKVTIEVAPDAAASRDWAREEFVPGATLDQAIQVPAGRTLRGRVLDAATGKPVAQAEVGEGWTLHKRVRTGQDGRYELRGWGSQGYNEVVCDAPGYVRAYVECEKVVAAEADAALDFRLERGHAAAGRVVDPNGKPLPDIYVAGVGMHHDGRNQYHNWVSARTDADGRFRLSGLRADLDQTLLVRRDGWATLIYHMPPAQEGVRDAGTITMRPPRFLRGRVVDANGKPIPRLSLGLWGSNSDREAMGKLAPVEGHNGWALLRMYLDLRKTCTTGCGEFAFGDLPEGTYSLVAYGPNNERLEHMKNIAVFADGETKPIVFVVPH